ncbi:hypothetical protein HY388_01730 [Candidatus Daviesbacteria bacterium]|nr:hypothetical protein [Candidatus Daviesbacteria bacterium]
MRTKKSISKSQWTKFWNDAGVYVRKPSRFVKNYNPRRDEKRLIKLGVSQASIDKVRRVFERKYQAPLLQFHKFTIFFSTDTDTVVKWTSSRTASEAFAKLFRKLNFNSFTAAKKSLHQLFLLYKLNDRGEGRTFEAKYTGHGSIQKLDGGLISGLLSTRHENASYKNLPKFRFDSATIIPLLKNSQGKSIYKFVRLKRSDGKIIFDISADSSKENNLIKQKLSKWFQSYIDTPEVKGDFTKLINFIKSGESEHFLLIGINFFDNEYKLSIFPQFNQLRNIASYQLMKQKFNRAGPEVLDKFVNIRVSNKEIQTKGQVFVEFYTRLTEGIIGAITLQLDDRRLNSLERKKLRSDFENDFALPLGKRIRVQDIPEEEIYRTFLQNVAKKQRKVEVRSEKSFNIYKTLLDNKLLTLKFESKDEARYCFNSNCRLKFQYKWNHRTCRNCGGWMFNAKTIIVDVIDEKRVAEFIYKKCLELGFTAERFKRKLIRRDIYTTEVRDSDRSICLTPITKPLSDHHLEILQFRYPNAVIITSKADAQILATTSHVEVLELYKIIPKLLSNDSQFIKQLIQRVNRQRLSRVRSLADESITRISTDQFYKDKNVVSKNFGAEFFEADCSILLSYIFGNSIWLGANKRGRAFPDGITAMPLTNTKYGCFIWDTKFCETAKVALGKDTKNAVYIKDGKKNQTIKDNGGLKGFIFISNVQPPKNFVSKYKKLAKNSGRIKISFIRSEHIKAIFDHFKDHEVLINGNSKIKQVFFDSIKKLLFSTAGKKKSYVIDTTELNRILNNNIREYNLLSTKRVNVK